jgi:hypothetical protein
MEHHIRDALWPEQRRPAGKTTRDDAMRAIGKYLNTNTTDGRHGEAED